MTTAATLVQRTRRFLQDWPEGDVTTASCTSGATTITVADATIYTPGTLIQIGTEGMQVRSGSGVTLTVFRGARGTTAASHASGDTILIRPRFLDIQYLDGLNAGVSATFPWLYMPHTSEYTGIGSSTYEYDIPTMVDGTIIPFVYKLQYQESGDLTYRDFRGWDVVRGATPFIKLRRPLPGGGSLRIMGFGPIPRMSGLTDNLSTYFPARAEDALIDFCSQYLLVASEAARAREDTGARDQRDNANRPGTAISAANQIYNRFQRKIMDSAMPPLPKHVVSIL